MCVCRKRTFLHQSLILKSQQNRIELVTRPDGNKNADVTFLVEEEAKCGTADVKMEAATGGNTEKVKQAAVGAEMTSSIKPRNKSRENMAPRRKRAPHKLPALPPAPPVPLTAECFIVSSRATFDQSKLLRALETRVKCATFSRVQTATSINRVVENIRPHQVTHILELKQTFGLNICTLEQ